MTRHQEARGQLCLQYNLAYSIQGHKVMHNRQDRKANAKYYRLKVNKFSCTQAYLW